MSLEDLNLALANEIAAATGDGKAEFMLTNQLLFVAASIAVRNGLSLAPFINLCIAAHGTAIGAWSTEGDRVRH